MENSSPGSDASPCNRARKALLTRHVESERLVPFAAMLAATKDAGHEDALRRLVAASPHALVRGAASFGLARQLIGQAESIELHGVRLETAASEEARRAIRTSLESDFGPRLAQRLRERDPTRLRAEAEALLQGLVAEPASSTWPTQTGDESLATLARVELAALRTLATGKPAPATAGTTLEGDAVALADFRGNVVLLVFSAQWCTACRMMYPLERELALSYAERPFTLFGVNGDADVAEARRAAEAEQMTWPILWDGGDQGPLAQLWNVRGWPRVVLLDARGFIRYTFHGAPDASILKPLVERLVREAERTGK